MTLAKVTSNASIANSPASSAAPSLRPAITGTLFFLFILGDVLGAGVYALMGVLAKEVGGALWAPLLVALLLALLTAGSHAELVTKYPKAGGAAVFAERAYKLPVVSFLVGFAMVAAGITSAARLSLAFAGDYLRTFIDVPRVPAAMAFLLLIALVNARVIKESIGCNMFMTVVELTGLVIVMAAGLIMFGERRADATRVMAFPAGVNPAIATLGGAIIAYYAFVGFATSANVAEEIKDPSRTYPCALFGSLCVTGFVYVGVGLASAVVLPPAELAGSSGPLLAVVNASGIGVPSWLLSLIALIAVANGALLTMIMSSRLTYGMAHQGLLPTKLGAVLPKRRTPWVAIVVTTACALGLIAIGNLQALAELVVLLLLFVFVFISTNVAVLVLRRDAIAHAHFRVWTLVPVLGVISCVLLLTQQSAQVWGVGALFVVVGIALYALSRLTAKSVATPASASPTAAK